MNILTVLDKEHALQLADFLDRLSVNGGSCNYGICAEIGSYLESVFGIEWGEDLINGWWKTSVKMWPKFSGNSKYPVPFEKIHPRTAFRASRLWDDHTQYGKDRRELCTFLANLIRSQCDE